MVNENPTLRPTSRRQPRIRSGRCYELAGQLSIDDPTWTLVHGTVRGEGGTRTGHAWLRRGETVYCAALNRSFVCADYVARYAAEEVATFDAVEAARAALSSGHWGPWHNVAGEG
jgi:hypothetical protein